MKYGGYSCFLATPQKTGVNQVIHVPAGASTLWLRLPLVTHGVDRTVHSLRGPHYLDRVVAGLDGPQPTADRKGITCSPKQVWIVYKTNRVDEGQRTPASASLVSFVATNSLHQVQYAILLRPESSQRHLAVVAELVEMRRAVTMGGGRSNLTSTPMKGDCRCG